MYTTGHPDHGLAGDRHGEALAVSMSDIVLPVQHAWPILLL